MNRDRRPADALPYLALLALSLALHLVGLSHPASVVFDEVHFGGFVNQYGWGHAYFFDIHPPHAKLLIAGVARLLGYDGRIDFRAIGAPFGASSGVPLRLAPALAGSALAPLVALLLRQLGSSLPAAILGGLLVALDGALTLHSRVIGLDAILLAASLGALSTCLALARTPPGRRRTLLAVACGALLGLAVGSKLTGLSAVALVGVVVAWSAVRDRQPGRIASWAGVAAWMAVAAAGVYLAGWVLHFALLPLPGPGDAWGRTGRLVTDIVETHRTMLRANVGLTRTHPYASAWWSWPLMLRPVFYWSAAGTPARLYLIGNPVVWWGSTLLLVVIAVDAALARVTMLRVDAPAGAPRPALWIPAFGFALAYLPLASVTRVLFLYHYFTPLLFAVMVVVGWLDHAGFTRPGGLLRQRASYYGAIALAAACFVVLAPLTYGLARGAGMADALFRLFPGWR